MACFMPKVSCLYSASVVENETSGCFWHDQSMALPRKKNAAPEVHLQSTVMSSFVTPVCIAVYFENLAVLLSDVCELYVSCLMKVFENSECCVPQVVIVTCEISAKYSYRI